GLVSVLALYVAPSVTESSIDAEVYFLGKVCIGAGVDDGVGGANVAVNGSARRRCEERSVDGLPRPLGDVDVGAEREVHGFMDEHRSPAVRSVVNREVVADLGEQTLRGLSGEAEPRRPLEL